MPTSPMSPAVVAFDVNETLVSLERLGERFVDEGLPDGSVELWFARVLRDGFALTATGRRADFLDLARTHLSAMFAAHRRDPDPDAVGNVLAALKEMEVHPDVEPAFARLRDAGVRIVTLTNGAPDTTRDWLTRADLDGYVEAYLGADALAGAWKPRPEPYTAAAEACGVEPGHLALVAVHSWDVCGAQAAGLTGGYCRRLEGRHLDVYPAPDVEGDTLVEVVDGLLAL